MLLNSGFTYKNRVGTYEIRSQPQTAADVYYVWGKRKSDEVIAATYEYGLNTIYTSVGTDEESVALKFAGIDIRKNREILDFCNAYGLPFENQIDSEENNDYIFQGVDRDSIPKPTEMLGGRIMFLCDFQHQVIRMRNVLRMYDAINTHNLKTIIEILAWFCFINFYEYDDDDFEPSYESPRFNEAFKRFIAYEEAENMSEDCDTLSKKIRLFLQKLYEDRYGPGEKVEGSTAVMKTWEYPDMMHETWQAYYKLFSALTEKTDITEIDPFGTVCFSRELTEDESRALFPDEESALKLGKSFLSDFFNWELSFIHPEMTFENGEFLPNLKISSLLQAMYVELFFRITPYTNLRKCANPTCNAFFEVARDNSKKIYCSTRCAQLMAKRKQREREKAQ